MQRKYIFLDEDEKDKLHVSSSLRLRAYIGLNALPLIPCDSIGCLISQSPTPTLSYGKTLQCSHTKKFKYVILFPWMDGAPCEQREGKYKQLSEPELKWIYVFALHIPFFILPPKCDFRHSAQYNLLNLPLAGCSAGVRHGHQSLKTTASTGFKGKKIGQQWC